MSETGDKEWALNHKQIWYMAINEEFITKALSEAGTEADMERLRRMTEWDSFKELFGDMSFDEAWDRYSTMYPPPFRRSG